jgi:uncharacterized protein (TIGR03083 family)
MLRPPDPIIILDLFPEERAELLGVISCLSIEQWHAPTACEGWNVKDVVAHLLGVELAKISRARDGYYATEPLQDEELGTFLNRINDEWVVAMRRFSPAVLYELLDESGVAFFKWLETVNLHAPGPAIAWAGQEPRPVWLDVAREYTERWHHQQHIREAVGADGLTDPHFMAPALATFVWSLPESVREANADEGAVVHVHISGPSGGDWVIKRQRGRWDLFAGSVDIAEARVVLDEDVAWRLFTNGITRTEAAKYVQIEGDTDLGQRILHAVAIIV